MKVVLDTNVFISGIFWKGPPYRILKLWAKNKIQIIATEKILTEYSQVLDRINKKEDITAKWQAFILKNSLVIQDKNIVNICRDPKDNKFLNCAIIGKADYIISGDEDLLTIKKIKSSKIITPNEFLKIILLHHKQPRIAQSKKHQHNFSTGA